MAVVTRIDTRRPSPPSDLTDAQATEWRAVTGTMPAGWFGRETYPMLACYCRHVCRSRWLAGQIGGHADRLLKAEGGLQLLDKLLAMAERETRAVAALARSMRLTRVMTLVLPAERRQASKPRITR